MTEKIQQYLREIEDEKDIKILWACETGSRAWGFHSTDSDYDIRLIYVHKKDWYISLSDKKDSIERMLENNDIDISGWEWKKSLKLLRKSNPALLERIQSPIVYTVDHECIKDLKKTASFCYSRIATIHHYLSMAKKFRFEMDENEPYKLKKFFYTLRSALVCKWILEKDLSPPIEFTKIYKTLDLNTSIVTRIDDLIDIKSTIKESYLHQGESLLFQLIDDCIVEAEEKKNGLPSSKVDHEKLEDLFKQYIDKYDH